MNYSGEGKKGLEYSLNSLRNKIREVEEMIKGDGFYTERKRKEKKVRSRSLSVVFLGITLVLFFASQALAQMPITGWDKAKFGMSPGELREAYGEEEKYYEDEFYQELDFIKNYYTSDPEKMESELKWKESNKEEFWYERKECWSEEKDGIFYPYQLSNTWLRVFGNYPDFIHFKFIDNQLFNISISVRTDSLWSLSEEEVHEFILKRTEKLTELKNTLIEKYGDCFEKIEEGAEQTRTETLKWVDKNGNILEVKNYYHYFWETSKGWTVCEGEVWYMINYFDKNLTELWEEKQDQWRKKVDERRERGEKLREKGIESF